VTVIDAKRGEVFWATYRQVPGGLQRFRDYAIGPPDDLASDLMATGEECLVVGDGALRYSDILNQISHVEMGTVGQAHPSAASLVELAHPRAIREEFVQPWALEPLYLRKADAEANFEQRNGANGANDVNGAGD
jgi:tRNA threonylcarbamoyladenosine biosynthesis protein TsaB